MAPPKLQALLQPESVEGTRYRSRDDLMADPKATPLDTDNQLIQTEAALRRANRDQIDAQRELEAEQRKRSKACSLLGRLVEECRE